MNIRLQKAIADAGYCSRRKAEVLIQEGKVQINRMICTQLGTKVDPQKDSIQILGQTINAKSKKVYYLFYKPKNVVTTLNDPEGRPTIADFLKKLPHRVYPVGRLDFGSEGLLLLTNDGALTQRMSHPSGGILKRYHVLLNSPVTLKDCKRLAAGARVEGKMVRPVSVKGLREKPRDQWVEFVLREGRKREIRVICEQNNLSVKRLIRVAIGRLTIKGLRPGQLKPIDVKNCL